MVIDKKNNTPDRDSFETGKFLFSLVIGLFIFEELLAIFLGNFSIARIIIGVLLFF